MSAEIPGRLLTRAAQAGHLVFRIEADEALASGIAIYGERFGRYPLDPAVVFALK